MGELSYIIMSTCVATIVMLAFVKNGVNNGFFDYLLYAIVGLIAGMIWPVTIILCIMAAGLLVIDHVFMR